MRKEVNGEKFVQGKDLVFVVDSNLGRVPESLWKKLFDSNSKEDEYEKYIKIEKEDEIAFYNSISEWIYSKNDLDEMSIDQIDELKEKLKKDELKYAVDTSFSMRDKARKIDVVKNKIETIRTYRKSIKPNTYLEKLNGEVRKYLSILSSEFPDWLVEYINTPEMQRLDKIGQNCGIDYTKICPTRYYYSVLTHSVAVALIIWNFTNDKKQTLAGLFHDIATPAFKHSIDFMNGDAETQESTETYTASIIEGSSKIMALLKRDNIKVEEVSNYKMYPVADSEIPRLCADRLDNTFLPGLANEKLWTTSEIEQVYNSLTLGTNESGNVEFVFKNQNMALKYLLKALEIYRSFISDNNRTIMQFYADIFSSMVEKGYLTKEDFYKLSDQEVIDRILNCEDEYLASRFNQFLNTSEVYKSYDEVMDKYSVKVSAKRRYVDPLVYIANAPVRLSNLSYEAYSEIESVKKTNFDYYTYLDLEFIPYAKGKLKGKNRY